MQMLRFPSLGRRARSGGRAKTVWAMEFVEVQPGKMALALGYLDDHWMRVRQEAKQQGVVLGYHRVSEVQLAGPGSTHRLASHSRLFSSCSPLSIPLDVICTFPPKVFRSEEILVVTPRP